MLRKPILFDLDSYCAIANSKSTTLEIEFGLPTSNRTLNLN